MSFLFLPSLSLAGSSALSGYFEAGHKSQSEDFEEEDNDREYSFQNYHLRLEHQPSGRLSFDLGSFIYNKNYTSADQLDNISKILKASSAYYLNKQKQESLRLDVKLKYKEKRYKNAPLSEYDQIMFSPAVTYVEKDSYAVSLSAGVNNYDYINDSGNDQLRLFSGLGVKKYLFEKKLVLVSTYKLETEAHERANRRKNKNALVFGADYIPGFLFFYNISTRAETGQRDSKDDDERDEDFDYSYMRFSAKTELRTFLKPLKGFGYQYFKKDYLTADLDHCGFYILSRWNYKMIDAETETLYFNLITKYKDVNYSLIPGNDYKKGTLELKATYNRKKNWKTSLALQGDNYTYEDSIRDKKRYSAGLSFEKLILLASKNLDISLNFKYKYTDNKQASNIEEKSVRLAFEYEF